VLLFLLLQFATKINTMQRNTVNLGGFCMGRMPYVSGNGDLSLRKSIHALALAGIFVFGRCQALRLSKSEKNKNPCER
jgi:hypothetical protein